MKIPRSKARKLYDAGIISYGEYLVYREDANFSKAIVVSSVLAIMFYAAVLLQFTYLNIQAHTSVYPPMEFTTGYFAFWTVEIVMLSSIKKHKINNKHESEDDPLDLASKLQGRISPGGSEKGGPAEGGADAIVHDG